MAKTFKDLGREAKVRLKSGFWTEQREDLAKSLALAREMGISESRAEQFFTQKIIESINGDKEDEFYLKVKELLLTEGEVSDAIGRLTDRAYYETLSYEEKQRYTLSLSERYLQALDRFRRESQFASLKTLEK